jgi:hypothetical protein
MLPGPAWDNGDSRCLALLNLEAALACQLLTEILEDVDGILLRHPKQQLLLAGIRRPYCPVCITMCPCHHHHHHNHHHHHHHHPSGNYEAS